MKYISPVASRLRRYFREEWTTLEIQAITGSGWVLMLQFAAQLILFVRGIILARLLSPSDFGLFGMVMILISALYAFTQIGVSTALIQKGDNIHAYLNTAWNLQVLRGIVFAGIMIALIPAVVWFYDSEQLANLIPFMAISVLIQGVGNIGLVVLQKDIAFKRIVFLNLTASIVDFTVSVFLAYRIQSVYALVFGSIANSMTFMVGSYFIHPFKPKLAVNFSQMRDLFGFGKWIFSGQVVSFLLYEGDDILVGRVLGAAPLGYYRMAYFLSNLPATQLTDTIYQVTYPFFSKAREDLSELRRTFLRTLRIVGTISLPASIGILILVPDFTRIFLGPKWLPVVEVAQILAIGGALRSVGSLTVPLFQATGKPNLVPLLGGIQLLIWVSLFFPLANRYQLKGVAFAVVISGIIVMPVALYLASKIVGCRIVDVARQLFDPILGSLVMSICLVYFRSESTNLPDILGLVLSAIVGACIYIAILGLLFWLRKSRPRLSRLSCVLL